MNDLDESKGSKRQRRGKEGGSGAGSQLGPFQDGCIGPASSPGLSVSGERAAGRSLCSSHLSFTHLCPLPSGLVKFFGTLVPKY